MLFRSTYAEDPKAMIDDAVVAPMYEAQQNATYKAGLPSDAQNALSVDNHLFRAYANGTMLQSQFNQALQLSDKFRRAAQAGLVSPDHLPADISAVRQAIAAARQGNVDRRTGTDIMAQVPEQVPAYPSLSGYYGGF